MKVKIEDHRDELFKAVAAQSQAALKEVGLVAEGYAKVGCPYITGTLRRSISHEVDGYDVYIGTNVEYAPYVELGARGRKPKHFLKKAAADHGDQYKEIIDRHLKT